MIGLDKSDNLKATFMTYKIRLMPTESQFCDLVTIDVITDIIPLALIHAVLDEEQRHEQRKRKLPAVLTVLLCIAMHLFPALALRQTLLRLVQGIRFLTGAGVSVTANRSAISEARYRLGVQPLARLFRRICCPIATVDTPGAFVFGLRLVALDGSIEQVLDWAENAAYFGGQKSSNFPLVQGAYLCECGTHVIFDAGFWSYAMDERKACRRLLRSVTADMLVMFDQGLYSFDMVADICSRNAQVLSRILPYVQLQPTVYLSDGTYLAAIAPSDPKRRAAGECLLLRVIEYTIDDPRRTGHQQRHRLITTLLDPLQYPALELVCEYHERWEVEIVFDEIDTHQLSAQPLRS